MLIKCPNCPTEVQSWPYCPLCGTDLRTVPLPYCSACRRFFPPGKRRCQLCHGNLIEKTTDTPPSQAAKAAPAAPQPVIPRPAAPAQVPASARHWRPRTAPPAAPSAAPPPPPPVNPGFSWPVPVMVAAAVAAILMLLGLMAAAKARRVSLNTAPPSAAIFIPPAPAQAPRENETALPPPAPAAAPFSNPEEGAAAGRTPSFLLGKAALEARPAETQHSQAFTPTPKPERPASAATETGRPPPPPAPSLAAPAGPPAAPAPAQAPPHRPSPERSGPAAPALTYAQFLRLVGYDADLRRDFDPTRCWAALEAPHMNARGWFIIPLPAAQLPDDAAPRYLQWRPDTGWLLARWNGPWSCIATRTLREAQRRGQVSYDPAEIEWLCHAPERVHAWSYPGGVYLVPLPDRWRPAGAWLINRYLLFEPKQGWTEYGRRVSVR